MEYSASHTLTERQGQAGGNAARGDLCPGKEGEIGAISRNATAHSVENVSGP